MASTPQISDLAIRFAAPARLLATRMGGKARNPNEVTGTVGTAGALLKDRLHVPVLASGPEFAAMSDIRHEHAVMAKEGRWAQLFAAMGAADGARTVGPGGCRQARLISEGGRFTLAEQLARRDWAAARDELSHLANVQAAHADDPMAAHLLAQAHLDYGWMRRIAEAGPGVPREAWQEFIAHTAYAEAALGDFDPIEEDSPLLAGTRYMLVRGIEDGETQCRDWYEDWSDLDPTDPEPHRLHAQHMLPQWFGSLQAFEKAAQIALRRTRYCTGSAAYAVFQLAAIDVLGDLPEATDIGLFVAGLRDHANATSCQKRANVVAAALTELLHNFGETPSPHRKMVHEALAHTLRHGVTEFHLSAWENGQAGIAYALTQVFGPELAHGEHLFPQSGGIVAQRPT